MSEETQSATEEVVEKDVATEEVAPVQTEEDQENVLTPEQQKLQDEIDKNVNSAKEMLRQVVDDIFTWDLPVYVLQVFPDTFRDLIRIKQAQSKELDEFDSQMREIDQKKQMLPISSLTFYEKDKK